jgi:4-hydroxy-2-oxoheptanedioate aldolase
MKLPRNYFKAAIRGDRPQIGVWNTAGGNTIPEMLGGAGYDWVLVDCEHAAIETIEVINALQAIGQFPETSALVRPAANDPVLFKRLLDMGAQTLLVPYIETAQEAAEAVRAMRYGPHGIRGMAGMTRATRYGQVEDYFTTAEQELCLIVQVETVTGIGNLADTARTDGVDGVFIGPADLSASMGLVGQMEHPEVDAVICDAIRKLVEMGVPAGVMALNPDTAKRYISLGASFVAVAVDLVLLAKVLRDTRELF